MNRSSFNGGLKSFSWAKVRSGASKYRIACNHLDKYSQRLSRVTIECLDFGECIEKYDHSEMLFYIDPPYVGNERVYSVHIEKSDHIRLYRILRNIKGKVILSYVSTGIINRMYHSWNRTEVQAHNFSVSRKGKNSTSTRTELILTNF